MSVDPAVLERYLPANLVEKVLGSGRLSLEENLRTVGYLSDLLSAVSMYVPEHVSRQTLLMTAEDYLTPRMVEGTFLFADITGFTPLTEALAKKGRAGAEELTQVINALFKQQLETVGKKNGSVLKFGGDAILAWFGRSQEPSHAERALRAASKMIRTVTRFRKMPAGVKAKLQMSIGVATGRVFAGRVGEAGDRNEYVVAGETLRRMARAEAAAESGEVFADRATVDLVRGILPLGREEGEFQEILRLPDEDEADESLDERSKLELHVSLSESLEEKVAKLVEGIETLRVFLPKPLFDRVKANPGRTDVEAEHREVTTMFVNFRGLDALIAGSDRDVSAVERPLSTFFRLVNETVERHGGIISRIGPATEGDNLLILFGAPTSTGNDARSAAAAALEIRDRTAELAAGGQVPFTLRIGINTGFAYCGDVGYLRKEYTVMGDPVNLAARLMSIAEEGTIRIGEATHSRLGRSLETQAMAPVAVKGKSEPVHTWVLVRLVEPSPLRMTTTTVQRRRGMLGRQAELRTMNQWCLEAIEGRGQAVVVHGEMGVGKSFFLGAVQKLATRLGMATVALGGSELEVERPNRVWVLLLLDLLGVAPSNDPEALYDSIRTSLQTRFPDLAMWDALIGSYLDLKVQLSDELYANMPARGRADQFVRILTTVLEATSREKPLAIFVDHVERLDKASLQLLHHLLDKIAAFRVVLCVASRDVKFFEMFFQLPHVHDVELPGLDPAATRRLIEEQIEVAGVADEVVQGIHERTRGNPLLVSEMVAGLVHQGVLVVDRARNQASLARRLEEAGLADQVHTYFISKLDRVGYSCRKVLHLSTVLPDPITIQDLQKLHSRLEKSDLDFPVELREAVAQGILVEAGEGGFSFRHPILKDVLYENIAFDWRRQMHREMGRILEERFFPNLERGTDLLAHHFERSDDHRRAVQYLILAADRAKDKYANVLAAEYYEKAIERIRSRGIEKDRLIPVMDRYSRVLELEGRFRDSIAALEECRKLALVSMATASSKIGRLHTQLGQLGEGEERLDIAQRTFEEQSDDYGLGHCLHNQGQLALARGSAAEAIRILTRSFECLRKVGDKDGIARCLHSLSRAHKATGDYLRAADYLKDSLSINETLGNLFGMGICRNTLGEIFVELERFDAADENLAVARRNLEEVGDKFSLASNSFSHGQLLAWRAKLEEAKTCLERGARIWEEIGEGSRAVRCRLEHARILLVQGHQEDAEKDLASAQGLEDAYLHATAALLEGDLRRDQGELEEARRRHKEALVLAQKAQLRDVECLAYLGLGRDLLVGSRLNQAQGAIHLAFQKARELQRRRLIIQAGAGLGDIYLRTGRADRAIEFYVAAREQARQVGYLDLLPEILSAFSEALLARHEDLGAALEAGKEAWAIADEKLASPAARIEALIAVVSTVLAAGKVQKADRHLERALRESEEFASPHLLARTHLLAARVAQATGDGERARSEALASSELSAQLGCLWLLVPACRILTEVDPASEIYRQTWQQAAEQMADAIADVTEA